MRFRHAVSIAASLLVGAARSQTLNDMMLAGDKAYLMMPPTVASEGQVETMSWSSDGRYLVLQRAVMKLPAKRLAELMLNPPSDMPSPNELFETRLESYDVETGNRRNLLNRPGQNYVSGGWVAGRAVYVAIVQTIPRMPDQKVESNLVRFDAANGTSAVVWRAASEPTEFPQLFLSPTRPIGFVAMRGADGVPSALALDADGRPSGAPMPLHGVPWPLGFSYWSGDGLTLVSVEGRRKGESYQQSFRQFDLRTMTSSVPKDRPEPYAPPISLQTNVITQRLGALHDRTFSVGLLTPGGEKPSAGEGKEPDPPGILDVEVERIEVSPTSRHVAYTHKGVALVRELVAVPRAAYERARDAAARTEALSKGKQCALALIMYAADNEDKLPSNKGDWAGSIKPYLRNESTLEGFVYTYPGGFLSEIAAPAMQEIGYVSAPGGRAVVYADGHVKFVADGSP